MKIEIERLIPKLKAAIEGQYFEVGILENDQHYEAIPKSTKQFAGGVARKINRVKADKEMQELGGELQGKYFWLSHPFMESNSEIIKFAKAYLAEIQKNKVTMNKIRNLVQAIVRNPILRGDYGSNSLYWTSIKGFDHVMIDTGQFFNSIQARVVKNV